MLVAITVLESNQFCTSLHSTKSIHMKVILKKCHAYLLINFNCLEGGKTSQAVIWGFLENIAVYYYSAILVV